MTEQNADADNSAEQVIADAEALLKGEDEVVTQETEVEQTEGTEKQEPAEAEETEIVPHGEKSRLGRKLARQEKEFGELKGQLSEMSTMLKTLAEKGVKVADPVIDEDLEPELSDYPSREEIQAHSKWSMRQVQKQIPVTKPADDWKQKYEQEYLKLLNETVNPEDDDELFALLTDSKDLTYNQIHTKDPHIDFAKNLRNATKAITEKLKKPQPNVQGRKPAGVAVPNNAPPARTMDRSKVMKGLSADERAIADSLSDDELKSVFG